MSIWWQMMSKKKISVVIPCYYAEKSILQVVEETTAEFEKLSTLLYQSEEVTDYLLAQMRMQQLVASTMERITREAGIQFEIPEA